MKFSFKPLGIFPIAKSKFETLGKYEFALSIEPTRSKFNSICEKIFDPMLSGAIPIYYGQKLVQISNSELNCDEKDRHSKRSTFLL